MCPGRPSPSRGGRYDGRKNSVLTMLDGRSQPLRRAFPGRSPVTLQRKIAGALARSPKDSRQTAEMLLSWLGGAGGAVTAHAIVLGGRGRSRPPPVAPDRVSFSPLGEGDIMYGLVNKAVEGLICSK